MSFQKILKISRPRFWIYELGPFIVGVVAYLHTQSNPSQSLSLMTVIAIGVFALYFLIPANILIYGINDVFDYETDKLNPKKVAYESLLMPSQHLSVMKWIALTNIPFIILLPFLKQDYATLFALFLFIFFASFYSAEPIRAKSKPILDSIFSASHYVTTGAFAYLLAGGQAGELSPLFIGAALSWAIAMHAYSAVPDIDADKASGIATIATLFKKQVTLLICGALYLFAGVAFMKVNLIVGLFFTVVYLTIVTLSLIAKDEERLFKLYTYFPKINTIAGAAIFFAVLF